MDLAEAMFGDDEMAALWSGDAFVRGMLTFEGALARAEAHAGIIPAEAAEAISAACRETRLDTTALFREAAVAGTPAIPLVRQLTERVEGEARGYVHWGATSQDVIDTALVLQMRDGLRLLIARLRDTGAACATLAAQHRQTPMVGRTLLQQALPITFGLKAARWLALVTRQVRRLADLRARIAVMQFGGAAGTLAALGAEGIRVTERLAAELGLAAPALPWHAERDRIAEVAAGLGVVAGAMAKIAGDLVLLAQTEVAEVAEAAAPGKGSSSAMPQKHNPVDAIEARAAARLALGVVPVLLDTMAQEHERAAGAWHAEWAALPDLFGYTAGAVAHVRAAVSGLEVSPERMREHLEASGGLVLSEALAMALARRMGRPGAQKLVRELAEHARQSGANFATVARADERVRAALSAEELTRAFDPLAYLGSTEVFIDRALADFQALEGEAVAG